MIVDKLSGMLPFLALGALGVANLVAAVDALRGARRAEELGEGRFELLRDQHDRLELLREERRMLLDELERERRERLEAQERVKQLMREHPHLELERELQRLTEELELEQEGRAHNHRERQRLGEELERERLARSGDQQNVQRLERDLQELQQLLDELQQALKAPKKGLWTNLLKSNNP
jgi:chromosome segregation ATPase